MDLSNSSDQRSMKSFWARREGTVGMGVLALLGVGGLFVAQALLPVILNVLTLGVAAMGQAIILGGLCLFAAAVLWVLFATPAPRLVGYYFKAMIRRATSVFVAVYPIEIMREFISKMESKKQLFSERKTDVRKQQRVLEETIKQNERDRVDALAKMKAAHGRGMDMEVTLLARQAGRLQEINERHKTSLSQITLLSERLTRVEQVCDYKVRDMKDHVRMLEQDHKISKATKSAISAARSILMGNDPDQELYDQAEEFVVEDYRATMGDVDDFMSATESILNGVDLQNGMWEEKAMAQLAVLEQTEKKLINNSPSGTVVTPAFNHAEVVELPVSSASGRYFN